MPFFLKLTNLRWTQWLSLVGLAVLFLALRWNNYDAPLGRDEGEYAYASQLIIHGLAPYQHAFIQKPPGVFYTYALCDLLLPHVYWFPRVIAAVFVALTAILIGIISRLEFGKGCLLPAAWLATPLILLPRLDLIDANVEPFLLLPLMGTVAVYCYSRQSINRAATACLAIARRRRVRERPTAKGAANSSVEQHENTGRHWLAAGFLAGVTLLYKYTAAPMLAFLFVVWLVETARAQGIKAIFRAVACAAAGGILALGMGLAYFLIHDGGRTFWECTVLFNRYYAGSNLFGLAYFGAECKDLWDNWWILFLVPWAILLRPSGSAWFWLGIFLCSVVATNGCCYSHYYSMIMPFLAILNVMGISALASRLSAWMPKLSSWSGPLLTTIVMLLVLRPDAPWILCSRERFVWQKMELSPFVEARLAAEKVSQMTTPDDFVYVAGSEPEILYYAQRFSPTRFITSYALMDPNPLAPGYQAEAINDLQQRPPKLIVFVQVGNSWTRQAASPPEFLNFMAAFLKSYRIVGAFVKPDFQSAYWIPDLTPNDFKTASLLLYERK